MKKVILAVIAIFYFIGSNNSSTKSSHKGPPTFVLTELNGRELEENAYFTIKYDQTFELKTGDGTIFKYTATQHVGSDPLCNIVAVDNLGRNTAICMKKTGSTSITVMLENDEMISNFKGHLK